MGSSNQLPLKLRLLQGNTADSLTAFLLDGAARTAFATLLTADFTTVGFSEKPLTFTAEAGFILADVTAFRVSGNDPFASATLSVALDHLAAATAVGGAVPEPAPFGLLGAAALGLFVVARRTRRES